MFLKKSDFFSSSKFRETDSLRFSLCKCTTDLIRYTLRWWTNIAYIKFSDNVLNSLNYLCGQHFYLKLYTRDFRARIFILLEERIKYWVKKKSESVNFEELLFFECFNFSTNQLQIKHITNLVFLALIEVIAGETKLAASTSSYKKKVSSIQHHNFSNTK